MLAAAVIPARSLLAGSEPPRPSSFRSALEAQFPRRPASGPALALEELAASLGLDLAPRRTETEIPSDEHGTPSVRKGDGRSRPAPETAKAFESVGSAAGQFVDREVRTSQEKVAPPSPSLERFLADHEGEMAAIQSLLLREDDVRWEMDASKGAESPLPNLLGFLRLQKLLLAKALIEIRGGRSDEALQTLEASWRFDEAVLGRPELISQLIHIAVAKLQVGVLRKIDAPPYGWSERLREGRALAGYAAAFENQFWFMQPDASDLTGKAGAFGRVLRRIGEEFQQRDLCEWAPGTLQKLVDESYEREGDELDKGDAAVPNLVDGFLRARRYEIDAELTALVVDARLERDASRRRHWPVKLLSAGRGACPEAKWTYRPLANGTVSLSYERRIAESDSPAVRMPFEFVAGQPNPPVRRPARKGPSS